ncbi:hypothetical protein BCV70DRAFT_189060 [Testicularia cyperi]|uniref:CNH domain-containing protein n=1 Tax=Testicularia cyperi TaxID=1882483 RepID=A0A317XQL2_9BASI|nr:hypothetical protein BCV70DRAFT_189060 [Testicularia cyperi]
MALATATTTGGSPEPVPPYTVDPILFPAIPDDDDDNDNSGNADALHYHPESAASTQKGQRAIRCAEADDAGIYIGTSNGYIHAYQLLSSPAVVGSSSSTASKRPRYQLRTSRCISHNAKPVERIVLLRSLHIAAVVCEGVLSFYSIADWTPLRSLPSIRAVSTIVLDDDETGRLEGTDAGGMVSLCVVRRKNIILAKVGLDPQGGGPLWAIVKEMALPGGAIFARRFADTLCIANATEYSLVNLSTGAITPLHLPISQTGESPSAQVRPSIITVPVPVTGPREGSSSPVLPRFGGSSPATTINDAREFLITSHTGTITLGVFIKPSGEPAPKLLEWPSHPRSVCFDGRHIVSLLRNDTVELHRLGADAVEKVQTQPLPPGLEPRFLQPTTAGFLTGADRTVSDGTDLMDFATTGSLDVEKVGLDNVGADPQILRRHVQMKPSANEGKACVLLCGRNSVSKVDQESLWDWAVDQLDRGHIETLQQGLAAHRKHMARNGGSPISMNHFKSLAAPHGALVLELLRRTRFFQVENLLDHSMLDPRLLLAIFPGRYTGHSPSESQASTRNEAVLLHAVASRLAPLRASNGSLKSVEQLIDDNLTVNYAPPLSVSRDPLLQELRTQLSRRATAMLLRSLRLWRQESATARAGSASVTWIGAYMDERMVSNVDARVDTAYLELLLDASAQDTASAEENERDLADLLASKHSCDTATLERLLEDHRRYTRLAEHHERQGQVERALQLWTEIIDGKLVDNTRVSTADAPPSVERVASLLEKQDDPALLSNYGTWLVKKDSKAGIRILTRRNAAAAAAEGGKDVSRAASKAEELDAIRAHKATLQALQSIDASAAEEYLETVALTTLKVQDEQLHRDLARLLLERVRLRLQTDAYRTRIEQVTQSYVTGHYAESFFAHLALDVSDDPGDLERLKLAILLQGSTVLDLESVLEQVEQIDALTYERAIVLGKLGRDREALALLAVALRDANSAETYCSQDGEVLSPMVAASVAQDHRALEPFTAMLKRTHAQRVRAHQRAAGQQKVSGQARKQTLLKQLLSVYMENGAEQSFRIATAHLLNTQALHLDSREVLALVPKDWPIQTLATFLSQSLRRQLHRKREMQMLRSISLCRNLDVAEERWARQRALGGKLQEGPDGSAGPPPSQGEQHLDDDHDTQNSDAKDERKSLTRPYGLDADSRETKRPFEGSKGGPASAIKEEIIRVQKEGAIDSTNSPERRDVDDLM